MDLFLSNAFLTFDTILNNGHLSEVRRTAGSLNPCEGREEEEEVVEEVTPAYAEAKCPTVFGAEMDLFLSNAFLTFDTVFNTGPLSEVGRAADSLNLPGGVEEEEVVTPAYAEAKSPTVFGAEMDLFLSNAFLTFDTVFNTGPLSEVGRAADSLNLPGGVEEVTPAYAEAKSPTVFGAEMDLFLSNAFLTFDTVFNTGPLSEVGRAAGSLNPPGGVEEEEVVTPAYAETKSPTVLGWSCEDGGMDFLLPCAVPDSVPNMGFLLGRCTGSSIPTFDEATSPTEKPQKSNNKFWRSLQKAGKTLKCLFLQKNEVETLIPSELNADSANPNLKDDAGLASPESNSNISPDQRKTVFDQLWRGKVEPVSTPQLEADPAIPDVREVVDLACPRSKTTVRPKKHKQKASKSPLFNLQRKEGTTVVQTQQLDADPAIPVGMDGADLACPESKTKIRLDKRKTLKRRFLGCFRRSNVEPVPTPQLVADPAIPVGMDGADLASRELNTHISFGAITAANARLQKIGAVPAHIGLKGGGYPDTNGAKNPGSKDDKNPRPKALGNPRNPRICNPKGTKNPGPIDAKNPGPKCDKNPRPKAPGNPRIPWCFNKILSKNPEPKDAGNPGPKDAGNPGPKDVKVVRPKNLNPFKKPSKKKPADPEPSTSVTKETFESKYQLLEMDVLGQGSFGIVYKGICKTDDRMVAIKKIIKHKEEDKYLQIPGYPKPLLTEVALMLKLRDGNRCPFVIEMYDWYESSQMFTLVMEYPQESESLCEFVDQYKLSENTARHLMHQAVQAVEHCLNNGIVHTDIHASNFLVQKKNMRLKLIDFGLGHLLNLDGHVSSDFRGARCCTPPEVETDKKYFAMPANAWALGTLLYFMVHGSYPSPINDLYAGEPKKYDKGLSKEIRELIDWCLAVNPAKRPRLFHVLCHKWFKTDWLYDKTPLVYRSKGKKTP